MPVSASQMMSRSPPASLGLGALTGLALTKWACPLNLGFPLRAKKRPTAASPMPIATMTTIRWARFSPSIRRTGQTCQVSGRRKRGYGPPGQIG